MTLKLHLREYLFRLWYWYVNKVDRNAEILFMNYGYHSEDKPVEIDEQNAHNRYSVQLYHHLASIVDLKDKDIVEIGCGRGGGLHYIAKRFLTASALGIDLNKQGIDFCNRHYKEAGISFLCGDAQNLVLEDNICDVVLNVESSHRYPEMARFLHEVYRILRSGGHFLFTDFRYDYEMEELRKDLELSGLSVIEERIINKEVVAALDLDDVRRRNLIKKLAPKFLHKIALNFAGTTGSDTYNKFASKKYVYFSYVLRKP